MTKALLLGKWLGLLGVCMAVLTVPAAAAEPPQVPAAVVWEGHGQGQIGYLEDGEEVTVLEAGEEYYRIDCYDMEGYIRRALVAEDKDGTCYVNCKEEAEDVFPVTRQQVKDAVALREAVCDTALAQVGVPYVYGGEDPSGFDCSGFVQYVFAQCGLSVSRVVTTQLADGAIVGKEDLCRGDLVVFQNTYVAGPSHIGIYLGDGQFAHAGSGGITVAALDDGYFAEHYLCARRVIAMEVPSIPVGRG